MSGTATDCTIASDLSVRIRRAGLPASLLLILLSVAAAQQRAAKASPQPSAGTAEVGGLTSQQADETITELRQVHQLLEKQQALLSRATAPQPVGPSLPEKGIQINVVSDWYSMGRSDAPVTLSNLRTISALFVSASTKMHMLTSRRTTSIPGR